MTPRASPAAARDRAASVRIPAARGRTHERDVEDVPPHVVVQEEVPQGHVRAEGQQRSTDPGDGRSDEVRGAGRARADHRQRDDCEHQPGEASCQEGIQPGADREAEVDVVVDVRSRQRAEDHQRAGTDAHAHAVLQDAGDPTQRRDRSRIEHPEPKAAGEAGWEVGAPRRERSSDQRACGDERDDRPTRGTGRVRCGGNRQARSRLHRDHWTTVARRSR